MHGLRLETQQLPVYVSGKGGQADRRGNLRGEGRRGGSEGQGNWAMARTGEEGGGGVGRKGAAGEVAESHYTMGNGYTCSGGAVCERDSAVLAR